ncbi:helix-turn-helix transcriptional regulator [Paralimibaculum aggregatum]|uniref:Helix-turn-helix transcriptional regulator n=1 Tax=Paralimibaculum aggregatum TaxID=3036245 RepID=A0ABQ6LTN5_9RHOB|nr:helix-turn-helix transcriptional regulator [Limibaculum sp. NKW23]GMG85440.1 helix-turn-helix transcriptional regulator [Limibaculum sp. NKW23]
MDKRALAGLFRRRLGELIEAHGHGLSGFARATGLDRSALGQFLDPGRDRLPRAETLRQLAEARGVSADWLLGLANVPEGGQEIASSVAIETELGEVGESPLARWQREAEGGKIRYVPSSLPDLFRLPGLADPAVEPARATARAAHAAGLVADARLRDTDVEICMGRQALENLAAGLGIWELVPAEGRRRQLLHMAAESERLYPAIRLHLFDGRRTYSPPFTVFAMKRAALYLGRRYLVVTGAEQVRGLARHFDELVREAVVPPHIVHRVLKALAERTT